MLRVITIILFQNDDGELDITVCVSPSMVNHIQDMPEEGNTTQSSGSDSDSESEDEVAKLSNDKQSLECELKELKEQLAECQRNLTLTNNVRIGHKHKVEELTSELKSKDDTIKNLEKKISTLHDTIKTLEKRNSALQDVICQNVSGNNYHSCNSLVILHLSSYH